MTDIKTALREATDKLHSLSPSAKIDAEILLAHVLNTTITFLYTYPEKQLVVKQSLLFQQLINQRMNGLPIAYLTGKREFWSLPLSVSPATLIPRPETELLVECILNLLKNVSSATILDLGTGTGAIALALASERHDWQIMASDYQQIIVDLAMQNGKQLGLTNITFVCSDWFSSIPTHPFHAIVSNPPYIAKNDPYLEKGDLRFEPQGALSSGEEGLDALTHIIQYSYDRLLPGGLLLLEHGFQQKQAVQKLLQQYHYEHITTWQDVQGHDRVSGGWRKK